ncbi:MAG: hypothetical protein HQL27_00985 [Candidatus Omnitrophica bacterium]|nr:hypothetical protein [Candidatus Omnitrophota bacterium]
MISVVFGVGMFCGCTSIQVQPVDSSLKINHVCIEENPKVTMMGGFVDMLREGFSRHGISTEVYSGKTPETCEYVLTYTALHSWDVSIYLSDAELILKKDGKQIASAKYHLTGKGGFSLMKWKSVKSKMDPVIDELLKNY